MRPLREIAGQIASKTGLYDPARVFYRTFVDISGNRLRRSLRDFYEQIVRKGDLVFDVGANIGMYSEVFASLGAHVIAVEPLPDNARIIQNRRYRKRITLVQMAIGAQEGIGELRVASAHKMGSMSSEWIEIAQATARFQDYTWGKTIEVPVTTLDSLCHTYGLPDFIKIDVEGYEERVLESLSTQPRYLSFEFNPEILEVAHQCLQKSFIDPSSACNFVLGEPSRFFLDHWENRETIMHYLREARADTYGDIFLRKP